MLAAESRITDIRLESRITDIRLESRITDIRLEIRITDIRLESRSPTCVSRWRKPKPGAEAKTRTNRRAGQPPTGQAETRAS